MPVFREIAENACITDVKRIYSIREAVDRLGILCDRLNVETGRPENDAKKIANIFQEFIIAARSGLYHLDSDTTESNIECMNRLSTGFDKIRSLNKGYEAICYSVSLTNEGSFVVTVTSGVSEKTFAKIENESLSLAIDATLGWLEA